MSDPSLAALADSKPLAIADIAAAPAALVDAALMLGARPDDGFFRSVLDVMPLAVYTTDAEGRITYYNRAAVDLAGREPTLGEDQWCVTWRLYNVDGTPLPHECCPMAVALKENRPIRGVEAILERPDGTRVPFRPYPTPLRDEAGALIGAVNLLVDVSDRKVAESARAYLAAIVESSDDAIISKDLNGIVTSWNAGAQAVFGYRSDEMIGQPILRLFPPDRMSEEDVILGRIRRGEKVDHFETVRRRKDGVDIDVALTISPVRDEAGRIIGVSKVARDVTEKKVADAALRDLNENLEARVAARTRELAAANERLMTEIAERERTEAELQQAQKMEVVGQLAAGVAHDFNNLLAAILGNLELLEMRIDDQRLLKLVQAATRSGRQGAKLNEQMLAFSRKQHLSPKAVDLNELLAGVGLLLARTLGGTVEIDTVLETDLWPAMVDPHQFELVLLNLAINARDAMPEGGKVVIETRNVESVAGDRSIDLAAGDYVLISVADTGTGMSPEVLARACEPFFTTKPAGKGSGLGLAQVYGLARQSGGTIRIKSALGEGTTVEVYLPRSRETIEHAAEPIEAAASMTAPRRARILLVDDHEEVREVIAAHLDALGYQTVQAANGRTALEILGDNCAAFDLLIADYAMPEMSGIELTRAVRARCPDLPAVVVTGYVDLSGFDGATESTILLQKPFRMSQLGAAVERALREAAQGRVAPKVVRLRTARTAQRG
ncbi:MAG TPA: PAS domain S-box protein [Stellaceae bacterium]|jgi:PAS domain S-box-containing protein|nr:PAS domain S-box protein [Stellaceae bacterium]